MVLSSPDMPLTTGTKTRTVSKFYAPLVGATVLTQAALIAAVPPLDSKDLGSYSFVRVCTSTPFLLLDLLGPLRFSTVIPCISRTILSCTGSTRDDFSVNSPDSKGSVLLRNEF
ncbi:hypothetical protein L195_g055093 [Trifolium pratense]|uniref:Uncharacterized protein n=1 Tax=Trifolium pratense TaxID=57577 RepID=A0A2K3KJG7_TRIPR|nr:hypothetical protein L195_g055093 [Trifolium pratense]